MKSRFVRLICLVLAFTLTGCQRLSPKLNITTKAPDYWPTDSWKTSTPEQQGLDSGKLAELFDAVRSNSIRLHSLLIIRNGYIVLEAYYPPYGPDIRHSIESNTKSIIGTLTGIAIDEGKSRMKIRKCELFPYRMIDNLDARKKSITQGEIDHE